MDAEADPVAVAREICLRLLTARPRSRGELAAALARRCVPPPVVDEVLDRLADVGLVDDRAFARAWVQSRHHGRGLARAGLARELRQRGLDDEEIAAGLALVSPEQERGAAFALASRRLARTPGLEPAVRLRRVVGVLTRKGYAPELALAAARAALVADGGPVVEAVPADPAP